MKRILSSDFYENDPADFKMPYGDYGRLAYENLLAKYEGLEKVSRGVIVRLGFR